MINAHEKHTLPLLAFWGRNMAPIRARGWIWPGFDYSEAEWKRLLALADSVSGDAYVGFQIVTAVLVIAAIGLAVAIGASVVTALYRITPPDLMQLGGLGPLVALALAVFALFGYGFPLVIRLAAAFTATQAMRAKLTVVPGDAELAAKIGRQFRRMAVFIAGVLFLIAASEFYLPDGVQHWAALVIAVGAGIVALIWL
jgi:hypothetical protein